MYISNIIYRKLCRAALAFLVFNPSSITLAANAPYAQVFSNKNASGVELANAFFELLSKTGSPTGVEGTTADQDKASKALIKPYLDPALLVQRATGERYTFDTYHPADVDEFQVGDLSVTAPAADVRVVRYFVRTTETLPDTALVMSKDKAPRLTVFHWSSADSRWKVLSHANFNTPIAVICNQKPIVDNNLVSPASTEDQVLGEKLIGQFYDLITKGDALPILHPEIQFQSASGIGYARLPNRPAPSKYDGLQFNRTIVTRNGRLLVVSTYTEAKQRTLMQNNQLRAGGAPNLSTFFKSDDGRWSMVAVASFAPPKALPDGLVCVPPGKLDHAP